VRGAQSAGAEISLPTLTNAHAAHSLTTAESVRKYPVHLRAVVTYYDPYIDPRHGALFVCDFSGCIFVSNPSKPVLPLHAGTVIDIEGVAGPETSRRSSNRPRYAPSVNRMCQRQHRE